MIKLVDVSKYYRSNGNVALGLHRINLEFSMGDFVAITGESGSGKSTLLNVISGSDTYEDGEIYFKGQETSYYDEADWENYRKEKIGFIYQNYNLIDSFSALDNVKTALFIIHPDMEEAQADKKAMEYLEKVGLREQAGKKGTQLSSGQKQRLSIARALAKETDIIVADEPTGNLDVENSRQIVEILSELSKEKLVLIVTHNYDEVEDYVTRKIRMHDGEVEEDIRLRPNRLEQKNDFDQIQDLEKKEQEKLLARKILHKMRKAKPHSLLVLMVLFLFIFTAIYIFFGSFEKNMDFSTAKVYSDQTYANGDQTRICVKKADKTAMTREDVEKLQSLSHVDFVDLYDTVNDVSYMMEEDTDYAFQFRVREGKTSLPDKISVTILDGSKMLKTVSGLSEKDISKGEFPQTANEIILNINDKKMIGENITIYLNRKNVWEENSICLNAVVTGITDCGEKGQVYISEELAQQLNVTTRRLENYTFYGIMGETGKGLIPGETYDSNPECTENDLEKVNKALIMNPIFLVNEDLRGNEIYLSREYYSDAYITASVGAATVYYQSKVEEIAYLFYGKTYERQREAMQILEGETQHSGPVVEVSRKFFDEIYPDQQSYQISVYMTDYAYTDRVIKAIENEGYEAVSVFRAGGTEYDADKANEQTTLLLISLAALLGVFVVGIFLIKTMMRGRNKDYRIMLLLGMNRSVIDRMNRLDITYNAVMAGIGTILLVNLAKILNIPYIASAVRYYDGFDYLIYLFILGVMMYCLYRSVRRVRKKNRRDV
ncbi:MAG: ABC transporter ATP-binding protein [Lachnospiraceae bacterium]|nr:ABC transporter ATP-binding protein [Lachnospiraceae bacterium]